ncbi:MAG: LptF/LptG family permease [Bacteroidales bacterium]
MRQNRDIKNSNLFPLVGKIDMYIIKKFLRTFLFIIAIMCLLIIVFDLTENLNDFSEVPLKDIILGYYMNLIPYLINMLTPLFVFVALIIFTSQMASNSENIAIFAGGVSFRRFLRPYFVSAFAIFMVSFTLGVWLLPHANTKRMEYRQKYQNGTKSAGLDIHRQISPSTYIYISSFNKNANTGYNFTIEEFDGKNLKSKISCRNLKWISAENKWKMSNYEGRIIKSEGDSLFSGTSMDTTLNIRPEDFVRIKYLNETMTNDELEHEIDRLAMNGVPNIIYKLERYRRFATPFSVFILTIIGVTLAFRKRRGGIGMNLLIGFILSFSYIFLMRMTEVFATNSGLDPIIAVWFPNILFAAIAFVLFRQADKK